MKRMQRHHQLISAMVVTVCAVSIAPADTLNVPAEYSTIQSAIDAAVDGDEVVVADGIYTGEGNRDMDFGGRLITVRSENGPDTCTIDIQGSEDEPHRAFHFQSEETAESIVHGFTIANGVAESGGALLIENGSSPSIMNCSFEDNTAIGLFPHGGGAVRVDGGQPTFGDCECIGNSAPRGGGLYATAGAHVNLRACVFRQNYVNHGGGGVNAVENTIIEATNCSFIENSAWEGGGALVVEATFTNCLFWFNSAEGKTMGAHAGAILGNNVAVTNSTFWNNGPNQIAVCGDSVVTVANSILWRSNNGTQISECWGGSIEAVSYSNIKGGWAGEGNIDADPLFFDPDNGHFRLAAGSPCIDAGDNAAVLEGITTDLDGNPRFVDDPGTTDCPQAPGTCGIPPVVDMGAYETCLPDFSGDASIGAADLALLLGAWGLCSDCEYCPTDLDGDCIVDAADLALLLGNWGACG